LIDVSKFSTVEVADGAVYLAGVSPDVGHAAFVLDAASGVERGHFQSGGEPTIAAVNDELIYLDDYRSGSSTRSTWRVGQSIGGSMSGLRGQPSEGCGKGL
jgi:hypothetical protein